MKNSCSLLLSLTLFFFTQTTLHAAKKQTTPKKSKNVFAGQLAQASQPITPPKRTPLADLKEVKVLKRKNDANNFRGAPIIDNQEDIFGASCQDAKADQPFALVKLTPSKRQAQHSIKRRKYSKKNKIAYSDEIKQLIAQANQKPSDDAMKFIPLANRIVSIGDSPASAITGSTPEKQVILHKLPNDLILYALEYGEIALFQSASRNNLVLSFTVTDISATYFNIRSHADQLDKGCITLGFDLSSGKLYHAKFEAARQNLGIPLKPQNIVGQLDENGYLSFQLKLAKKKK